jgi:hypothetical protein
MKKLLFLLAMIFAITLKAQVPFIGNRLFVSANKQDSLWINFYADSISFKSNKPIHFNTDVYSKGILLGSGSGAETDPIWISEKAFYQSKSDTSIYSATKYWTNTQGFLKSFTETDPLYRNDSAYIKGNIRSLKVATDTTSEWVSRTIYVSLPNDPQTPGNDVTGTGSVSFPYATIAKALSTLKHTLRNAITIQLDSGTFKFDRACIMYIKNFFLANNQLIFIGKMTQYITGLTFSASTTPFTYTATSGGSSPNWTYNQLDEYFCKQGSNYFPIESNTSNLIYTTAASVPTGILYKVETIFDMDPCYMAPFYLGTAQSNSLYSTQILFQNVTMLLDVATTSFLSIGRFSTSASMYSYINIIAKPKTGTLTYYSFGNGLFFFTRSIFKKYASGSGIFTLNGNCAPILNITGCVMKNTYTSKAGNGLDAGGYLGLYQMSTGGNNIWSGFDVGISKGNALINGTGTQMIRKCNNAFGSHLYGSPNPFVNFTIYLDSVNYLFNFAYNLPVNLFKFTLYGTPLLGTWNPSSTFKYFYGPNADIRYNGIYPEQELKLSSTLVNNSTDSISIGDKSYNRSIEIKYNITRGTDYRTGTLKILNTGTVLLFDPGDYFPPTDIGVTFDGAYYSGSSNTIKLKWSTSNTGTAATITYDAFRQNY